MSPTKHDFDEIRSRNPTINSMRLFEKHCSRNIIVNGVTHVRSSTTGKRLRQNVQTLAWDGRRLDILVDVDCSFCERAGPCAILAVHKTVGRVRVYRKHHSAFTFQQY